MVRNTRYKQKRRGRRNTRPGAPKGNVNALKSDAFSDLRGRRLDQRTKLAKALSAAESALISSLGGDLSPQELILVDRIVYKLARITLFEIATLTGKGRTEDTDKVYLAWSNSLRLDLQALGLERRQKDVTELTAYMREAYSEKE